MTPAGSAKRDGISVEVAPGGALRSLELEPGALRLGGVGLARAITALVSEASGKADEAAAQAMRAELGELTADDLSALGLARDESSKTTGSDTWRH